MMRASRNIRSIGLSDYPSFVVNPVGMLRGLNVSSVQRLKLGRMPELHCLYDGFELVAMSREKFRMMAIEEDAKALPYHFTSTLNGLPEIKGPFTPWLPQLQFLHLHREDLGLLCPPDPPMLAKIDDLRELVLESCSISPDFHSPWTSVNTQRSLRLRKFHLRLEKCDPAPIRGVETFLAAFSGLIELGLLLEGTLPIINIDTFVKNHGPTLTRFLIDEKSQTSTPTMEDQSILATPPDGHSPERHLQIATEVRTWSTSLQITQRSTII